MSTATCSRASTIPAVIGLPRWYLETKWKQSSTRQLAASCQPQKGSANQHVSGGQGRNRTTDTRIFSPLLYQLSYLAAVGEGRVLDRPGWRPSSNLKPKPLIRDSIFVVEAESGRRVRHHACFDARMATRSTAPRRAPTRKAAAEGSRRGPSRRPGKAERAVPLPL